MTTYAQGNTMMELTNNTNGAIGCLLVLLIACFGAYSKDAEINFDRLTVEDGLASNKVYSILQDSRGFMWFGTSEGLNRYDGYAFKSYRHDPSDPGSISGNYIWFDCLYEDRFGLIWVGTRTAGLNRFDPATETFKRFQHDPNDDSSLSNDHGITVYGDRSGGLWIGTDEGLNRFDRATGTFRRFQHNPEDAASIAHNRIWQIREIVRGDEAELWIATHNGLDKLDRATERFEHIKIDGLYPKNAILGPITDSYHDQRGTLWVGSFMGLVKLDLKTLMPEFYRHNPEKSNTLRSNVVTSVSPNPGTQGRVLWLTTMRGLHRFDTETEAFTTYGPNKENEDGFRAYTAAASYVDKTQGLWFGTSTDGILRLNEQKRSASLIERDPNNPNRLAGWVVRAIHEDLAGDLWIGTQVGLKKCNVQTGVFTSYMFDPDTLSVVSGNIISGITEDEDGILWLGTWGGGLIRFNPLSGQFQQHLHDPNDPNSVPSNRVGRVYFDSSGTLWLGTAGQVLSRLSREDQAKGKFTNFNPEPEKAPNLENYMAFAFLEDSHGGFWVGSHLKGLYLFNREAGEFKAYKHNKKDPSSLSSNVVNGMFETRSENDTVLWIGTGNGLNRFERSSQTFKRIYNNEPGGSDFIYSLTGDAHNNLWIQNQRGISKFDTERHSFVNYAGSRGLPADMSNSYSYHRNRKGEIFFGGMEDLVHFHPDSIPSNSHIPPVVLTDFKVLHESVGLDTSITMKKGIKLTHDQNFFSFQFAALDYTEPKKNRYIYKLEGLDVDWINSGDRPFANYTAVKPGKYIFRVKGSNNDGIWNEEGTSVRITILPPWWRTPLAYGLYILLFVGALYGIRRYELRRLNLRNELKIKSVEAEKLIEVDRLKSRFFASISHEFRTPLTLILGPVGKWLVNMQRPEMRADFHMVQRNARRLQQLINQLLDLSKLQSGKMQLQARPENIVELLRMNTMTFESLAKQKGIDLQFRATEEETIAYVDRDMLEKIVVNLLSNAIKFTSDKGKITVAVAVTAAVEKNDLLTAAGFAEIRISDTGVGIPQDQLDKVFNHFYQVGDDAGNGGTGIGLALAKELVELHHGVITIESELGKGTTFIVKLPLGKDHLTAEQIVETVPGDRVSSISKHMSDSSVQEARPGISQTLENNEFPTLLIVEDNVDMRAYIRGCLAESYRLIEAQNGTQGAKQAHKHAPDLIISDVMMPEMDGFELCEKLKTDERTSHIPVILLTARASGDSKVAGLEIGADAYLTKPFEVKELQVRVKNLIEQRRKLRESFRQELVIQPSEVTVNSMDEAFLVRVIAVIEARIDDPSFETDDLARESGVGRRQLNRKLRALTGQSVRKFIRTIRLKRAAQLLQQQAGTVTEIAYQVGFNSIAHFAKIFREQFGVAPSEYRKNG